jgi:hypothetical protein
VVTQTGWKVVNKPIICFSRYIHQEPQVEPKENGDIGLLKKYVNIKNDHDFLLSAVYTVSCIIPNIPKPMLIFRGEEGSAKTSSMRILKQLVDPSILDGMDVPTKEEDFGRICEAHALVFLDNLDKLSSKASNALCRVVTGASLDTRILYTNKGSALYKFKRPIMMSGIADILSRKDALDRSLIISLQRIPDDEYKSEKELSEQFEQDRPFILGAMFDLLSQAIDKYPTIQFKATARMSDWYRWAYCIADCMNGYTGEDFVKAFQSIKDRQNEVAIDNSPVARAIIWLLKDKDEWIGTADGLLTLFESEKANKEDSEIRNLCKELGRLTSATLGRYLKQAETTLKTVGIEIDWHYQPNRTKRIYKVKDSQKYSDTGNTAVLEENTITVKDLEELSLRLALTK